MKTDPAGSCSKGNFLRLPSGPEYIQGQLGTKLLESKYCHGIIAFQRGQLAQLGCVMQKVLWDKQRDIIMIAIDLGKLGELAQGRHDHIEMVVPHATLQLQGLQGTCDSLRENPKGTQVQMSELTDVHALTQVTQV